MSPGKQFPTFQTTVVPSSSPSRLPYEKVMFRALARSLSWSSV